MARVARSQPSAKLNTSVIENRVEEAIAIASQQGLLSGGRTLTLRGRMPSQLVEEAKRKTGIHSDSKLLEAALASIVVADDYGEWLIGQSGTIHRDIDLEL